MMTKDDYRHFVCIVAGDCPEELMKEYDKNKKVEPYVVYKYKDAEYLRKLHIANYEKMLENTTDEKAKDYIKDSIIELSEMDDDDFFFELADGYMMDAKTGDAMSDMNPKGKWSSYQKGKVFSIPFITKDGREIFQARKGDIDWDKIHCSNSEVYRRAWEMVMEGSEPKDEYERLIHDNMQDKVAYFEKFETKDNYILSNTAFWGYAFLSDKTGWEDASNCEDQFVWIANFYNLFIDNLPDDTLLTIYECVK